MAPPFSPAVEFLIAGVSAGDRSTAVQDIRLAEADWLSLPGDAQRHGLSAALSPALQCRSDAPREVAALVATRLRLNAAAALQGVSELQLAVRALEKAGVTAVMLKGPALSQWLYGTPVYRCFTDLDFLIASEDLDRAYAVLNALGYELPRDMSAAVARTIYGALGAWPLTGQRKYPIDLHWRLAHVRFPAPLSAEMVIQEAGHLSLGGMTVRIPDPTHAALLTLLHGAKHLWCTLESVVEIAAFTRRPDVDWLAVRDLARKAHAWNGCAAGLRLASELLGADVPQPLRATPWPAATEALRAEAISSLSLPSGVFQDRWAERRAHHVAFDRALEGIGYDMWRVIAPTPLEWQWCTLPDRLRWLYVPMRLVRLAGEVMRGRLQTRPAVADSPRL
jgi:hypothetical protein